MHKACRVVKAQALGLNLQIEFALLGFEVVDCGHDVFLWLWLVVGHDRNHRKGDEGDQELPSLRGVAADEFKERAKACAKGQNECKDVSLFHGGFSLMLERFSANVILLLALVWKLAVKPCG